MSKRDPAQDIAKGLGILFVLQLHGIQLNMVCFYVFNALVAFSMTVFFFLAGYNYRDKGLSPVKSMGKRVGKLLKTYVLWTLGTFLVMGTYFLIRGDGSPDEILKSFGASVLSESGCKMIGWKLPVSLFQHVLAPYWFIQYLITASVIFYLSSKYVLVSFKRLIFAVIILLGITFAFISFKVYLPWGIHCAPSIAAIMLTGAYLGKDDKLFSITSKPFMIVLYALASIVVVDTIGYFYPAAGILGAGLLGEFIGPVEVFICYLISILGSYFLVSFGRLLNLIPVLNKCLIWLGRHTLIILLIHRPIAYVIRDVMGLPHFISGRPLYVDSITSGNLIAFLLIFVIMVPVIMMIDRLKAWKIKERS